MNTYYFKFKIYHPLDIVFITFTLEHFLYHTYNTVNVKMCNAPHNSKFTRRSKSDQYDGTLKSKCLYPPMI